MAKIDKSGEIMTGGTTAPRITCDWYRRDIPEKIIKKLARIAGLEYRDKGRHGGGNLCMEVAELPTQRQKALVVLGGLVTQLGDGGTDRAVENSGASWLDVLGWRENEEYAKLWAAAMRVKEEVLATRLSDAMWDRALNGKKGKEVTKGLDGEEVAVDIVKFDNGLGLRLLQIAGHMGQSVKPGRQLRNTGIGVDVAIGKEEEVSDTVLFMDRETAFSTMKAGKAVAVGGKAGEK